MEGEESASVESKSDHKLLEDRFERNEIEFSHGKLLVRDVEPENKRDDVPLVSTLGFGTGNIALERTVTELFYKGEHVIELDFLGGGKGVAGREGSSGEFNRQGMLMAEFMDNYFAQNPHVEKLDIMAQSAGLFRLFAISDLRPDLLPKIRNVILTSPVGLSEDESIKNLLERNKAEADRYKAGPKGEFDLDNDKNLQKAFKQMYLRHPIKAFKEVISMAKGGQYPGLEKLKEAGIKVAILQGDEDKLADVKMLFERMSKGYEEPFGQGVNPLTDETMHVYEPKDQKMPPVDVLRMMAGGHGIQVDNPNKIANTILETIDYLKKPSSHPITEQRSHS